MNAASLALLSALAAPGALSAPGTTGSENGPPVASTPAAVSTATAASAADAVIVNNVAFAVDVSSLMPVGAADSFDASVERVYFWNRLSVKDPPARIKHVWYHEGKNVAEFVLTLRYNKTRVWTYKKVRPGSWRVEITDERGEPITVTAFVVRPKPKPGT